MKNIYIVDYYSSSKKNGIGTYIRELMLCLKEMEVNICHIAYCHDTKMFSVEENNEVRQIQIPYIQDFCDMHYNVFNKFLRLYIEDSSDNLFLFSYGLHEMLLKTLKKSFPLSKLAFVIHNMSWTSSMLGDTAELKKCFTLDIFEKNYPDLIADFSEEKRMYETADRLVALAPETVDLLQSVYKVSSRKIMLIPNGLQDTYSKLSKENRNQLKAKLFIPSCEKVILFVGRVARVKGEYQIINALKKVVKTYPNFRLVVVGTLFEARKIMDHVGEIASKITFTGQIYKDRLSEWYQVADIGLLCSYWEQCSYAGIEMMMYGLPVVASDGFCVGDMFVNDVNAKVARIGDRNHLEGFENNLSEAFLQLLQSDELCRTLGENGRAMYESKYQIENMKKGYQIFLD